MQLVVIRIGPGKRGELLGLVLPGRPVMAVEMGVFLEPRIAVGGKHLAVGVDVDPLSLRLLEQLFEVLQVMPGDEDRLPLLRSEGNLRGNRVAVGAGVGRIQQLHRPEIHLAAFHREPQQLPEAGLRIDKGGERLMEEGEDRLVLLAEDLRHGPHRRQAP